MISEILPDLDQQYPLSAADELDDDVENNDE